MTKKAIVRVWNEIDINEIEPRLLIAGSTSADCGNCKEVGMPFDTIRCPKCGVAFKYMGTRLAGSVSEAKRLKLKRPDLVLLDFKDFKEAKARSKARGFLGD